LTVAQDQRAAALLASAHRRLEEYASHIPDDVLRQSFWENMPVHRNLRTAYLQQATDGMNITGTARRRKRR